MSSWVVVTGFEAQLSGDRDCDGKVVGSFVSIPAGGIIRTDGESTEFAAQGIVIAERFELRG